MDGCTATTAELNTLAGSGMSSATMTNLAGLTTHEIDTLQGISTGLSATELNYVNGVTSAIQTQLDDKQATMSAGTNIDISSNTIHASGCPDFACIGRVATDHGHDIGESGYVLYQHDQIVDKIGSGAYLSGGKVVLPAGTYYYEATAHLRNTSGSNDVSWAKLQLFTDGGTAIGYPSMSYMGERSAHQFVIIGTFTTSGDGFQLKAWASSDDDGRVHYGDASGTTQRQASTIKFWRSDR